MKKVIKILNRLVFWATHPSYPYYRFREFIYRKKNPDLPWFTKGAIEKIITVLRKDWNYFEWGSGKSTVWFSKRVRKVVSIEHSKKWYNRISIELRENHIKNIEYFYIPVSKVEKSTSGVDFFNDYTDSILSFPDETFDCILVDGKSRNACLINSISKLKSKGYLIMDDTDRKYDLSPVLKWKCHRTYNGIKETSIWEKP